MPSVTVKARNRTSGQESAPVTVSYSVSHLRVGMDAPTGAEWTSALSTWPGLRYAREFGADGPDANRLPELPAMSAQKVTTLSNNAHLHVSWKDDVEQLTPWLSTLTRPVYLTWYHEPMGDVTPVLYRQTATRLTEIVNGHPKKNMILGHGPIVTRYWLDEKGGDPSDWAYPGMRFYGVDAYMPASADSYYSNAKMFDVAFSRIRALYPDIRILVPEYGLARIASDKTGAGRAAAMREHIAYLQKLPYVDAVAYFNSSKFPQWELNGHQLETEAWREIQANQ